MTVLALQNAVGYCVVCSAAFTPAETVLWSTDSKSGVHQSCARKGPAHAKQAKASRALDSSLTVPAPEGKAYLPFQRAGIAYAADRSHVLIADEMGLGKTVQAIGILNLKPELRQVLVVCPASLLSNWIVEWCAWDVASNRCVRMFPFLECRRQGCKHTGGLAIVVSYNRLNSVPDQPWDAFIFDEAHYVQNPKALRTLEVKRHAAQARKVIALTGTPLDKPKQLWTLIGILQPQLESGPAAWLRFGKRYCAGFLRWMTHAPVGDPCTYTKPVKPRDDGMVETLGNTCKRAKAEHRKVWDFDGASNLAELQERMRSTFMVRRLKEDVLTELPPKRRKIVVLDGRESGEDYSRAVAALDKGEGVAFEEISRLRHAQALAKLPACISYIREALVTSRKIIVFAHHRDIIDGLREGLSEFTSVCVDGETPVGKRGFRVEQFQTDPNIRLFIGSISAAGVGLTLTAAWHEIFVEVDWSTRTMLQAEDRAHRIGQANFVLIEHLIVDGTLDAHIVKTLVRKMNVASKALDREGGEVLPAISGCLCLAAPTGGAHASWCPESFLDTVQPAPKLGPVIQALQLAKLLCPRCSKPMLKAASWCEECKPRPPTAEEKAVYARHGKILAAVRAMLELGKFGALDVRFAESLARAPRLTLGQANAAQQMLARHGVKV